MGILDSKQRFVDTVITAEGRRQLASGQFKVEFATFTDADVFYEKSGSQSVTADLGSRIQLEAPTALPTDIVTLETSVFGKVISETPGLSILEGVTGVSGTFQVIDGQIKQFENSGSKNLISGSVYRQVIGGFLSGTIGNFSALGTIGSNDDRFGPQKMSLSTDLAEFEVTNENINSICSMPVGWLGWTTEAFSQDRHMSHLPNYKYLPPKNKKSPTDPEGKTLYDYPNNQQGDLMSLERLENEVRFLPSREIDFSETSRQNNIVCQLFEVTDNTITKLSTIDFGQFETGDPSQPNKRFFFAGKVFKPRASNRLTYINMFTVEMS